MLAAILLLALGLRLYGINWDNGGLFHPDERAILQHVFDMQAPDGSDLGELLTPESPLNPGWFNYGSLPIYALKMVQWAAQPFTDINIFDLRFPGRAISTVADLFTIFVAYLIGSRFMSTRVGILAAGLLAISVIHIQLSHFFAFDGILTAFIVAGVFFSIRVARHGRMRDSALAGLMLGLALATKVSAAPLVLPILVGHGLFAFTGPADAVVGPSIGGGAAALRQWTAYRGILLAAIVALVSLFITQPYMLLDSETFFRNVGEQSQMVRRIADLPYTRQYVGTTQYVYQATQLGMWGLGPALGVVSWVGLAAGVVWTVRGRQKSDIVIMSWVLPYLLVTGWFDVKFLRYMLPLTPFLVLYAARTLWAVTDYLRLRGGPSRRWLAYLPVAIVIAFTAHYALSFVGGVYSGEHPAFEASKWLADNAQAGSTIAQEHWEEGIPQQPGLRYVQDRLELYNPDTPQKYQKVFDLLSGTDYLVLFSNRLYGTIPRLPDRYPLGLKYYESLFNGELGFELVHNSGRAISSLGVSYREDPFARVPFGAPSGYVSPTSGTLSLDSGWSDESFSVYDHPEVLVFQNTGHLTPEQMLEVIGSDSSTVGDGPANPPALMLSTDEAERQQSGGTWSDIAFLRGLSDWLVWLPWLVALELFALAAIPLAFIAFRSFPDRGYLFAKPLGLLLASTVTWLLASARWVPFGFGGAVLGIVGVGMVSAAIAWRQRADLIYFFRSRRRRVLAMELIFLLAFFSFVAIRAANPDLWHPYRGGEKPMDFAYLNAVVRSTFMPPYDPWFSGGYLNYYYFGQFITANVIRLTGLDPAVAYNLAVPTFFSLTVVGAFSIVFGLTWLTVRARGGRPDRMKAPWVAGIGAALLVAVAGNIDGLVQLIQGLPAGQFDFWRSSRMMEPGSPGNEITEFPFFSFLFADLHAHMIAIPFAILSTGLGVSLAASIGRGRAVLSNWTALFVLGVATGALRAMNTWDFPTQLLIAGVLVGGGEVLLNTRVPVFKRTRTAILKLAFVLLVGYVVYYPFHANFELFDNGVVASKTRTPLWRYLAVHSVFLYLLGGWLLFTAIAMRSDLRRCFRRAAAAIGAPRWFIPFVTVMIFAAAATFMFGSLSTIAFTLVLAACLTLTAAALLGSTRPGGRYAAIAVALGAIALSIGAGVDLVTVKDDIGRMNTVFKFYLQAWWLMAVAGAFLGWWLWSAGPASIRRSNLAGKAWTLGLAILLVSVFIYPVMGTQVRIRDRFDTSFQSLDGMAYMTNATQYEGGKPLLLVSDLVAIKWMQSNVDGSPVIVEGITDLYHWGNRFSIYTGLPAVIGWDWHQRQQRAGYSTYVTERRQDVNDFYLTPSTDSAARFLDDYNVKYVIVGELERVLYAPSSLAKFDRMGQLSVVYQDGPVTIYEVSHPAQLAQ